MSYLTDGVRRGTFANRPATAPDGTVYVCTDGLVQYIRKNGAWNPYYGSIPLITPPTASNFTVSQTASNSSLVDDPSGLLFSGTHRTGVSSEDSAIATQPNPGGTGAAYKLTVGFIHNPGGQTASFGFKNYHITGICVYNSSNTHLRNFSLYTNAAGEFKFQLANKTGAFTGSGNISGGFDAGAYPLLNGPMRWFRVEDDGATNRTWSISSDGILFQSIWIEARTVGFGSGGSNQPDRIGTYINPWNANASMKILSYQLTSP